MLFRSDSVTLQMVAFSVDGFRGNETQGWAFKGTVTGYISASFASTPAATESALGLTPGSRYRHVHEIPGLGKSKEEAAGKMNSRLGEGKNSVSGISSKVSLFVDTRVGRFSAALEIEFSAGCISGKITITGDSHCAPGAPSVEFTGFLQVDCGDGMVTGNGKVTGARRCTDEGDALIDASLTIAELVVKPPDSGVTMSVSDVAILLDNYTLPAESAHGGVAPWYLDISGNANIKFAGAEGPGLPVDFQGNYELYAVVIHQGRSADGGHYMGWVRAAGADNDQWHIFDDADVTESDSDAFFDDGAPKGEDGLADALSSAFSSLSRFG